MSPPPGVSMFFGNLISIIISPPPGDWKYVKFNLYPNPQSARLLAGRGDMIIAIMIHLYIQNPGGVT